MTTAAWAVVALVFALGLALPAAVRPLLERLGIVDIPNDRSSHTVVALRGVGLATFVAIAAGLILVVILGPVDEAGRALLMTSMLTGLFAALVGLAEDVRGIPTRDRAMLQLGVGVVGAIAITVVAGADPILIPLGALSVAAYVNVTNFMDGVDAISGLHAVVVGAVYALIGVLVDAPWLILGSAMLGAAFLGFLPWNVLRGRMFLGDVGSYLLGGTIAATAFAAFVSGVSPVALTGPVAIYLADTGTTLLRRIRRGEPWFEAHRTHTYQRLTDRGSSHVQVALIVALFSAASGLVGLPALSGSVPVSAGCVIGIMVLVIGYLRTVPAMPATPPIDDVT